MKKFITAAALIAAGTAFANADSLTFATTATGTNGGAYCGVAFTLGGTDTARFSADGEVPASVTLDSVVFTWRSGNNNTDSYLYITDSNNVALAVSELVVSTGSGGTGTFTFDAMSSLLGAENTLTLDTGATYYAYFAQGSTVTNGVTLGATVATGVFNNVQLNAAGNGGLSTGTAAQWGFLNGQQALRDTTYAPTMTISTTISSIPEPSAFGLLTGVGALALVAARRRRSK